jgi:hypothetical protein
MVTAGVLHDTRMGQLKLILRLSIDDPPSRTAEALHPTHRLLTDGVAELAGTTPETVSQYHRSGALEAIQLHPRARLFFLRSAVDEWLASRE